MVVKGRRNSCDTIEMKRLRMARSSLSFVSISRRFSVSSRSASIRFRSVDVLYGDQHRFLVGEGQFVRGDRNVDQPAVFGAVLPLPGDAIAASIMFEIFEQARDFAFGAHVGGMHGEEFVARIAVVETGSIVHVEKGERLPVKNPHRDRVGGKQQAEFLFAVIRHFDQLGAPRRIRALAAGREQRR